MNNGYQCFSRKQHYVDDSLLVNNVYSTHSFNFSVNHIDRNLPVSVMNFNTLLSS